MNSWTSRLLDAASCGSAVDWGRAGFEALQFDLGPRTVSGRGSLRGMFSVPPREARDGLLDPRPLRAHQLPERLLLGRVELEVAVYQGLEVIIWLGQRVKPPTGTGHLRIGVLVKGWVDGDLIVGVHPWT